MTRGFPACVLLAVAMSAAAQGSVQGAGEREQAIQRGQIGASAAYRSLEQAQYEKKLAEQDVLNSEEAYQAAQEQAAALRRHLEAARKALDAARAKEAAARKRYDEALAAVDRAFGKPKSVKMFPWDGATAAPRHPHGITPAECAPPRRHRPG
jgi:hypothetical protein